MNEDKDMLPILHRRIAELSIENMKLRTEVIDLQDEVKLLDKRMNLMQNVHGKLIKHKMQDLRACQAEVTFLRGGRM